MEAKDAFIPKTKVEGARRARYDKALEALRGGGEPDLSLADWIRRACDEKAARDLKRR